MPFRDDDDLMSDYCPKCGAYTGGDSICPNCGAKIFDDSGLAEIEEDEEGGGDGGGDGGDEEEES